VARKVKIAVCSTPLRVHGERDQDKYEFNLHMAEGLLAQAAEQGADIACLPEGFPLTGVLKSGPVNPQWFEALPGGLTYQRMSAAARRLHMNVIAPTYAVENSLRRNVALVFDRYGNYAGGYHKVHMTNLEEEWGIVPGNDWPVFDLDFGRIGITICFDVNFPEGFRVLALRGAEIIFHPTVYSMYGEVGWEAVIQARAIDNCVYVCPVNNGIEKDDPWVPGMVLNRSSVIGPDGIVLADRGRYWGVSVAEVDLDCPRLVRGFGVGGLANFREQLWKHRRTDTYGDITEKGYWVETGYPQQGVTSSAPR